MKKPFLTIILALFGLLSMVQAEVTLQPLRPIQPKDTGTADIRWNFDTLERDLRKIKNNQTYTGSTTFETIYIDSMVSTDTITESTVNAGVTVQSNKIISNSSQLTSADITTIFGNTTTTYVWNIDSASSESQTDIIGSKALTVVAGELESANDVLGNAKFCKWSDGDTYLQSTDAVFNVANTADTDDFIVGGWVYIPDYTPAATVDLFSNSGDGGIANGFLVIITTAGRLRTYLVGASAVNTNIALSSTGWHHILFAREVGVGTKTYLNGQLVATTADITIGTTQSKFQLGGRNGATNLPEDDTRYDEVIFRKGVLPTNLDDCVRELYARSAKKFAVKDANNTVLIPQNKETFSSFSAYSTDAQSIQNNARVTVVFATKVHDILNEYNNTTGVFTAQYAGIYQVNWQVASASAEWAAGEYWIADLVKNDSSREGNTSRGYFEYSPATVTRIAMSRGSAVISLAAGDYLKIKINHNQGAAVDTLSNGLYNLFQVARVS